MGTNFLLVSIWRKFSGLRGVVVTYCLTRNDERGCITNIYSKLTCFLLNGTAGYVIKMNNTKLLQASIGPKDYFLPFTFVGSSVDLPG